jgi:sec-independent protein translocase protein TatA
MEGLAPWHIIVLIAVIVLLFGGKRIPEAMRGMGEGIRSFKEGMRADSQPSTPVNPAPPIPPVSTAPPPTVHENK